MKVYKRLLQLYVSWSRKLIYFASTDCS